MSQHSSASAFIALPCGALDISGQNLADMREGHLGVRAPPEGGAWGSRLLYAIPFVLQSTSHRSADGAAKQVSACLQPELARTLQC